MRPVIQTFVAFKLKQVTSQGFQNIQTTFVSKYSKSFTNMGKQSENLQFSKNRSH